MATDCRQMPDAPTTTLQRTLRSLPASLSTLAEAAHVSRSTLARIAAGELKATPQVVRAVTPVLERWARTYTHAARRLRAAREGHADAAGATARVTRRSWVP